MAQRTRTHIHCAWKQLDEKVKMTPHQHKTHQWPEVIFEIRLLSAEDKVGVAISFGFAIFRWPQWFDTLNGST